MKASVAFLVLYKQENRLNFEKTHWLTEILSWK